MFFFGWDVSLYNHVYVYMYVYVCMYVCNVCMCVWCVGVCHSSALSLKDTNKSNKKNDESSINSNSTNNNNPSQILLITEIPYVGKPEFLHKFRNVLKSAFDTTRRMIIFEMASEFEGSKDDLSIFGDLINHPRVSFIRFNPGLFVFFCLCVVCVFVPWCVCVLI